MTERNREKYNAYMNDYMKNRYKRRRIEAVEKLGGKCTSCGSFESLEFDHIDPAGKDFTMAKAASFSETRWQKELEKCQLLCTDCHKLKHSVDNPCGTPQKYWNGCKCQACKAAYSKHHKKYRKDRSDGIAGL